MTKKKMKKEIRRAKEFYSRLADEAVEELATRIKQLQIENGILEKSLVSCENALHEKETIITYLETKVWDKE